MTFSYWSYSSSFSMEAFFQSVYTFMCIWKNGITVFFYFVIFLTNFVQLAENLDFSSWVVNCVIGREVWILETHIFNRKNRLEQIIEGLLLITYSGFQTIFIVKTDLFILKTPIYCCRQVVRRRYFYSQNTFLVLEPLQQEI